MPWLLSVSGSLISSSSRDTAIDFTIARMEEIPFRTQNGSIAMLTDTGYRPLILKGINLGAATPGTFPGEIAYSVTAEMYEDWIRLIGEAGFNCIRIYTLHPPVFYEKLAKLQQQASLRSYPAVPGDLA